MDEIKYLLKFGKREHLVVNQQYIYVSIKKNMWCVMKQWRTEQKTVLNCGSSSTKADAEKDCVQFSEAVSGGGITNAI